MKKLSAVILTILMLASITACGNKVDPEPEKEPTSDSAQENKSDKDTSDDASVDETPGDASEDETPGDTSEDETSGDTSEDDTDEDNSGDNEDTSKDDTSKDNSGDKADVDETSKDNSESKPAEQVSAVKTTLPLKEYPSGSYFTKNGEACTDHDNCDWSVDDCNCINFDLSIQSMGFAKYVYYTVFGKHLTNEDKTNYDIDLTAQTAKQTLSGLREGAYIAVKHKSGVPHFMNVISTDDNGITVYQANYGGGCKVTVMTFTWEQFATQFTHLDYIAK